jgi:phasin
MSTIRIWALFLAIPVTVRPACSKVLFRSNLRLRRSQGALGLLILQQIARLNAVAIHADPQEEMTMAATDRFDVPPEMRAFAEKSVEQARQAFDGFISAAHHAMSAFEGQAETARKGAKDVTEKAMTFAERNITSAFEFAQELVRARGVEDVLRLQADYIKRQMEVLTEQARELGESTSKAAKDAAAPKR